MRMPSILDPANVMSLVRIPLALLVWLDPHNRIFLLTVVALAAVSDWLDGWLGRKEHKDLTGTANVGAWLDPVCDKIFVASAALAVVVAYDAAPVVVALLLVRDFSLVILTVIFRFAGGRALFHAHDFRATWTGKLTTVLQTATIAAVVLLPDAVMLFALASACIGAVAVIDRVALVLRQRGSAAA